MISGRAWRQHLDGHVLGNQVALDELADEIEIGLRGGREPDLDFLESELHQLLEHAVLARRVHRFDEGLVAIAQVDTAPDRGLGDDAVRPGPVGQADRGEGDVFFRRILEHGITSA